MGEILVNENTVTDEQVFAVFNLNYPGMEQVREAVEKGDISLARRKLADYFRERTRPAFLFDYRGTPLKKIKEDESPYLFQAFLGSQGKLKEFALGAGRALMEGYYIPPGNKSASIYLGTELENAPHFDCRADYGKKSRTPSNMFTRGQWMEYLFFLYQETGEEEVVEKFKTLLQAFWREYPLNIEDTGKEANRFQYSEDRTVMSVGWLAVTYIELLYTEMVYAAGEETVFGLIKHLWFLGSQFERFQEDTYRPYNHHLWERGLVPYILGTVFPEIPDFAAMKEKGREVICRHVKEDFNEAGGYNEHSIGYWSGAALGEMLFRGVYLGRRNQSALLDKEAEERIRSTFQVLASIAPPGADFPSVGDSGGTQVEEILKLGEKMIPNTSCAELLRYRQGKAPDISSLPLYYSNPLAGFTCARTDFGPQATYILVSTKTDCGRSGHNHMDMLSLSLWVRGQEFIGEPYARRGYPRVRMGSEQRGYLYNMNSHNTVLAYGKPIAPDEMYASQYGVFRPDSPVLDFQKYPEGMYAEAMHGGYSFCGHYRTILFSAEGNILIRDEIWPGSRAKGNHIQRWHTVPECTCTKIDEDAVLLEKNGIKLLCLWRGAIGIRIWKNDQLLCPEIFEKKEHLGNIIDAEFGCADAKETDESGCSLSLALIDITDSEDCCLVQIRQRLRKVVKIADAREKLRSLDHILQLQNGHA